MSVTVDPIILALFGHESLSSKSYFMSYCMHGAFVYLAVGPIITLDSLSSLMCLSGSSLTFKHMIHVR